MIFREIIENVLSAIRTLDLHGIERTAETAGKSGSMLFLRFCNLVVDDKTHELTVISDKE